MAGETSSRFDPTPGKPYGECVTCGITLETKAEADDHRSRTFKGPVGKSHATRASNPERNRRIEGAVTSEVEDALQTVFETLLDWVDRGDLTTEEVTEALKSYGSEFADGWTEYLKED